MRLATSTADALGIGPCGGERVVGARGATGHHTIDIHIHSVPLNQPGSATLHLGKALGAGQAHSSTAAEGGDGAVGHGRSMKTTTDPTCGAQARVTTEQML